MSSTFRSTPPATTARTLLRPDLDVFFDADCRFCTRTAHVLHRLDRARRLRLIPLTRAPELAGDAPSEEKLLASMHVRDSSGRWSAGGAAWLAIAGVVPALLPIGLVARLPAVRSMVEPTYGLIARNRHRISRLLGDGECALGPRRA